MKEKTVIAGTILFNELFKFEKDYSLKIPDYQRPYVWDIDKVETLINDLDYHIRNNSNNEYYMGSILFYNDSGSYEIIDGQQRLTTLLILDKIARKENSFLDIHKDKINFIFNSPISKKHIFDVKNYLQNHKIDWLTSNWLKIISYLTFSTIITKKQDDAFTFFETQNNRGVRLGVADYLKSYHLRELKNDEAQQETFAKKWGINKKGFLDNLFNEVIWRGRLWKGSNVEYENSDMVLTEFQKKTRVPKQQNRVEIFPNLKNKIAHSIVWNQSNDITLETSPISLRANSLNYPFIFRQPIEKGTGFFLYTEKYAATYNYLFKNTEFDIKELNEFSKYYNDIYVKGRVSEYLKMLYRLAIVLYYDKFEHKSIDKFAKYLDYFIGVKRVGLNSIYDKTPIKLLRDSKLNLLDVISEAFIPEQIFEFILDTTDDGIYKRDNIKLKRPKKKDLDGNPIGDEYVIDNSVRARYKRAVLGYYNKESIGNLKGFREWIQE